MIESDWNIFMNCILKASDNYVHYKPPILNGLEHRFEGEQFLKFLIMKEINASSLNGKIQVIENEKYDFLIDNNIRVSFKSVCSTDKGGEYFQHMKGKKVIKLSTPKDIQLINTQSIKGNINDYVGSLFDYLVILQHQSSNKYIPKIGIISTPKLVNGDILNQSSHQIKAKIPNDLYDVGFMEGEKSTRPSK